MWLHCVPAIIGGGRKPMFARPFSSISVQSVACAIPIIKAGLEVQYKLKNFCYYIEGITLVSVGLDSLRLNELKAMYILIH